MAICPQCNVPSAKGAQFCRSCGASLGPVEPVPPAPGRSDAPSSGRRAVSIPLPVLSVLVVAVFALAVTIGLLLANGGEEPAGESSRTAADTAEASTGQGQADDAGSGGPTPTEVSSEPAPPARIDPARTAVTASSPNASDCGATVTYGPDNTSDGVPETAWQVPGNGVGHAITFNLGSETQVAEVGLVPGYDKVQPCDEGTDRFLQNFRVSAVRWTFDDGTSVQQPLDISQRTLQTIAVDETTLRVRMDIVSTVPGAVGQDVDTAISEIAVFGTPG